MKDLYGMGHAMETGYRIINTELDGICSCANCRRFKDSTCPAEKEIRNESYTCDYYKINLGDK